MSEDSDDYEHNDDEDLNGEHDERKHTDLEQFAEVSIGNQDQANVVFAKFPIDVIRCIMEFLPAHRVFHPCNNVECLKKYAVQHPKGHNHRGSASFFYFRLVSSRWYQASKMCVQQWKNLLIAFGPKEILPTSIHRQRGRGCKVNARTGMCSVVTHYKKDQLGAVYSHTNVTYTDVLRIMGAKYLQDATKKFNANTKKLQTQLKHETIVQLKIFQLRYHLQHYEESFSKHKSYYEMGVKPVKRRKVKKLADAE